MSARLTIAAAVAFFTGTTLLLSCLRPFRRTALTARLGPYAPGPPHRGGAGLLSAESFREVLAPLARTVGASIAAAVGVTEGLDRRLRRVHSSMDVTSFRLRQLGWAGVTMFSGTLFALVVAFPPPIAALCVLGSWLLGFLIPEQRLAAASQDWQRRIFDELPVVAEQLGMLVSAGWSLGAALRRTAAQGSGRCAADITRVVARIRQGLGDVDALREWADLADVDSLDRLVSVLALNRDMPDIGHLISEEARAMRLEAQRRRIETIERRTEQVWIPVTVAALIPGVLLMGVPFVGALHMFSGQ